MENYNPNMSMCERVRINEQKNGFDPSEPECPQCGCHNMVTVAGEPILCIPCMWDRMNFTMTDYKKRLAETYKESKK